MLSRFLSAKGDVWENQRLQACDRVSNTQGGSMPVHFLCVHVSRCPMQTADQLCLGTGCRCVLGTPLRGRPSAILRAEWSITKGSWNIWESLLPASTAYQCSQSVQEAKIDARSVWNSGFFPCGWRSKMNLCWHQALQPQRIWIMQATTNT